MLPATLEGGVGFRPRVEVRGRVPMETLRLKVGVLVVRRDMVALVFRTNTLPERGLGLVPDFGSLMEALRFIPP